MDSFRTAETWDVLIDGKFRVTQLTQKRKLSDENCRWIKHCPEGYDVMNNGYLEFINEYLMEKMELAPTCLIPNNV